MDALNPRRARLLNIDFDNQGLGETVEMLLERPNSLRFAYVVTPNADHIERLRRMPRLRMVYRGAMLCLLDSQFIGHLARYWGLRTPTVVTGADLTAALLGSLDGARVGVIGLKPAVFAALAARYPRIALQHHQPPMGLLHNAAAMHRARDFAGSENFAFTFIALGSPVQELLAYAIAAKGEATGIGLCIGAALEFCAGTMPRAPLWMRRRGLEWCYRLLREPLRLSTRYLIGNPKVLAALAAEGLRQKWAETSLNREIR